MGCIDGILSEDVDCFVFGASAVIRIPPQISRRSYMQQPIQVYKASSFEPATFTRGGLLLIALFAGNDYDRVCSTIDSYPLTNLPFNTLGWT